MLHIDPSKNVVGRLDDESFGIMMTAMNKLRTGRQAAKFLRSIGIEVNRRRRSRYGGGGTFVVEGKRMTAKEIMAFAEPYWRNRAFA